MANNFKPIIAGNNPLSSDVNQITQVFSGTADVGQLSLCPAQNTPGVPTLASGGAGNPNGAYYYKAVLITGFKQSDGSYYINGFAPSADSTQISVTNSKINLTNIAIGSSGTIGRAIYRTLAGGATGSEKFLAVIWDNATTSYVDNTADGTLGTGMPNSLSNPAANGTSIPASVPTINTTGTSFTVNPLVTNYGVATGPANTYAVNISPAPSSYALGLSVFVYFNVANTGASTINFNGLGAINIVKDVNVALVQGDILTGQIVNLIYDGTNFQMIPDYSAQLTDYINHKADNVTAHGIDNIQRKIRMGAI